MGAALRSAAANPASRSDPVASLMNTETTAFPSIKDAPIQNREPSMIIM